MATVDRAALMQAANAVKDKADLIKGMQGTIDGHRSELMSGWSSTAAMTFQQVHDQFDQDFNRVIRALEGMYENLADQKLQYDSREEEAKVAMSDVQKFLNGGG